MIWIIATIVAAVALYSLWALWLSRRAYRCAAIVELPQRGDPRVTFSPPTADPVDLFRMGLNYGAKLYWVIATEPLVAAENFEILAREITAMWATPDRLIDSLPTAVAIKKLDRPLAAQGIERFTIRYSRTDYKTMASSAIIINSVPRPGLSQNLIWNYVVLMDAIHERIPVDLRLRTARALLVWFDRVIALGPPSPAVASLPSLIRNADAAWTYSENSRLGA
jgi:hypothetical protein